MNTPERPSFPSRSHGDAPILGGCPTLLPSAPGALPVYTPEYLKLVRRQRHWWDGFSTRPGDWFLNLRTGELQLMLGQRATDHWSMRNFCLVPDLGLLHDAYQVLCAELTEDVEDCPMEISTTQRGEWRVEARTPVGHIITFAADSQETALLSALVALADGIARVMLASPRLKSRGSRH